jgi:hypothetical protein
MSMPWAPLPGGQAPPSFGMPPSMTSLTYFLVTNSKTSLCKFDSNIDDLLIFYVNLGLIVILEYFGFLACEFICLAALRLTSQRRGGR